MSERQQPRAKNIAHANDGGMDPPVPLDPPLSDLLLYFIVVFVCVLLLLRFHAHRTSLLAIRMCPFNLILDEFLNVFKFNVCIISDCWSASN